MPAEPDRPPSANRPVAFALLDGLAGSNSQTRGVAAALGLPCEERTLAYQREWPWQRALGLVRLTPETEAALLAPPTPALVISTGRRAGAAARWLKQALIRRDGRGPRLIQIQDPRFGHDAFDRIMVPSHDRALDRQRRRPNVRIITGAPHPLTREAIQAAAGDWAARWGDLPRPWIGVLIGGDSGRRRLDGDIARTLADQAGALAARAGGSLLVTTSRRTRPDALEALRTALAEGSVPARLMPWTNEPGANPYKAMLALSDGLIVTGDSMSMLTEATLPGGPLWIFSPPGWARALHARFHAHLSDAGLARMLDDATPWAPWTHDALNPAPEIAAEARRVLGMET
jgi:mitochondrial fission protein ELM1